jgi:peptidoglycan/xylan/chitin deacetylase (PgdA/CDA1 family)
MKSTFTRGPAALLALTAALAGCGGGERPAGDRSAPGDSATATVRDSAGGNVAESGPRDTTYGPRNTMGRIPVLEYHVIADKETQYTITREHFRKDLELVYARGYRPVTIAQMLDKDFSAVPAGMSPVVFVFDDASDSQFRYIEKNGKLEIDPTSGLGIWEDFAKQHPDWKGKAVFCMLNGGEAGHNFFGDNPKYGGQKKEWRLQKVKYLADQGHELCAHTLWHMQLSKFPDDKVQENIARNVMGIDSAVAGYRVRTMALPQGLWPKNRPLAWKGSWKDPKTGKVVEYNFDAVLEVSGGPARSPYDPQFNGHSINRVEAFGNQVGMALDRLDKTRTRFVK